MKSAPPLHDGEEMVFDHIPHMATYKRAAMFLIAVSLLPTIAFTFAFDDSYWVIAPVFITCMLLMQERFTMGRHRAWVTTQRIILQSGDVPLGDIVSVTPKQVYVKVEYRGPEKSVLLYYPKDGKALAQAIQTAQQEAA